MEKENISTAQLKSFVHLSSLSQSIGNLEVWEKIEHGIQGGTGFGNFRVLVYSQHIIRITATLQDRFQDFSYSLVAQPEEVDFDIKESEELLTLSTASIVLEIQKNPVRFVFKNKKGEVINEDEPGFGTSWIRQESYAYKKLQPGERFIGLGEKTGDLDRKGQGYVHYNTDYFGYPLDGDPLYVSTPFYIGLHQGMAYGIYLDNSSRSFFNFGASNDRFSSFSVDDGPMNYYFIHHEELADIVKSYASLTGYMDMPPQWSLGYQQCRYSYYPDTEVLTVAENFRNKKIPADVIHFDIHYMDQYKIFTWDKERFPNPKALIDKLRSMGIRVVVIVDPGIKIEEGYESYHQGLKGGLFLSYQDGSPYIGEVWPGRCHFPDFTKPEAREWWGKSFKGYIDAGVKGFWNDMNEIATWGQKLPENIVFDYEGHKTGTRSGRNMYGMQMARATKEGTQKLLDGERPFVLTRAGFSGVQRYSAVWTGDNVSDEEHMLLGVRLVNSLGLAGIPFTGYDVGGFVGNSGEELYGRWVSIGAFSPFYRSHTMINTRDAEPWAFGEEVEEIAANYIRLRYRLMPYLYSVFYEGHKSGMPVARSLTLDHTWEAQIFEEHYQNQYLFGPSFLICPLKASEKIARVYLPKGDWYYLYDDQAYAGEQKMYVEAPIERLPVFVKAGSIVPMQSQVYFFDQKNDAILYLHLYQGKEGSEFLYYEDDGTTYRHQKGEYLSRLMKYEGSNLRLAASEGAFKSQYTSIQLILHGFGELSQVSVNGQAKTCEKESLRFIEPISKFDPVLDAGEEIHCLVQSIRFDWTDEEISIEW